MPVIHFTPSYLAKDAGIVDRITTTCRGKAGIVDSVTVSASLRAGIVERLAVPLTSSAGAVERFSVILSVSAGVVTVIAPLAALSDTFTSFVMNTKTAGMGEYTNFPFTSLFKHPLGILGFTADGCFNLTGNDDAGTAITAEIVSGVSNLGTDQLKWVTDAYVECRSTGRFTLTIIYDETDEYVCNLEPPQGVEGLHFERIKLPRGLDGTHIQFRFANVAGSNFDIQSLRLITVPKSRRIK